MKESLYSSEAKTGKDAPVLQLLQEHVQGLSDELLSVRVKEFGHPTASLDELFPDYFEADKSIGSIDKDRLFIQAIVCCAYARSSNEPDVLKRDALELGASAMQEASIVESIHTHNDINTVDERLEIIDTAHDLLTIALTKYDAEAEHSLRIMFRQAFTRVYKDIVCGEITPDTKMELLDELDFLHGEAGILPLPIATGLRAEIKVLHDLWSSYTKRGQLIALPATTRGGSGKFMRHQTHDLDTFRQKNDGSWLVLRGIEVKARKDDELDLEIRHRYSESVLAHVQPGKPIRYSFEHKNLAVNNSDIDHAN